MRIFISIVIVLALSATLGAVVVGMRVFDGLVVEKPYEAGLAWDEAHQKNTLSRTDCDIQRGPCVQETGDGAGTVFDIQPKPVSPMSDLAFIVSLTKNGAPVTDAAVKLDLSMPGMFMGKNQPALKHVGGGRYEGKGVLTKCMSGKKKWLAKIIIDESGKTVVADFVFEAN